MSLSVKTDMSMRIFYIRTDILNQKYLRIYGTGLIILLLSFFVTLIKLILEKKKSTPTNTKFERPHQPVTSSFNIPDVSNRNNIQSHFFNDPFAPVYYVPQITTLESDPPSQPIRLQQPSLSAIETNDLPSTSQFFCKHYKQNLVFLGIKHDPNSQQS